MADDGKRTEMVCVKVTERMALDLLHMAAAQERSVSDYVFCVLRTKLYGEMVKLEAVAAQMTTSDKVGR